MTEKLSLLSNCSDERSYNVIGKEQKLKGCSVEQSDLVTVVSEGKQTTGGGKFTNHAVTIDNRNSATLRWKNQRRVKGR